MAAKLRADSAAPSFSIMCIMFILPIMFLVNMSELLQSLLDFCCLNLSQFIE